MANEWLDRARAYVTERSPRERMVLLGGGIVLLVLVGYGLIYEPLDQARLKLAKHLPEQRAALRLMQVQVAEIKHLRGSMADSGKGSLEQRVRSTAAALGIGGDFAQFAVLTDGQIQLATQPIQTDTWINWLMDLERQGVTISRAHIDAGDQPGLAKLGLTLTGSRQ
jgi:general secretion pathway protein M